MTALHGISNNIFKNFLTPFMFVSFPGWFSALDANIKLSTTTIDVDGNQYTAPSAPDYSDVNLSLPGYFEFPSPGVGRISHVITNHANISFDTATNDWGLIVSWMAHSQNFLGTVFGGKLDTAVSIYSGDTFTFLAGSIELETVL